MTRGGDPILSFPSITPAQVLAVVAFFLGQAVSFGLIDGTVQEAAMSAATAVVSLVYLIVDAHIRGKRNEHVGKVRSAALSAGLPDPAARSAR